MSDDRPEEGGESACRLNLVCPSCGHLGDGPRREQCPVCGTPMPDEAED
jgi:rubrerythrin